MDIADPQRKARQHHSHGIHTFHKVMCRATMLLWCNLLLQRQAGPGMWRYLQVGCLACPIHSNKEAMQRRDFLKAEASLAAAGFPAQSLLAVAASSPLQFL
jgi:hypothetical protein